MNMPNPTLSSAGSTMSHQHLRPNPQYNPERAAQIAASLNNTTVQHQQHCQPPHQINITTNGNNQHSHPHTGTTNPNLTSSPF